MTVQNPCISKNLSLNGKYKLNFDFDSRFIIKSESYTDIFIIRTRDATNITDFIIYQPFQHSKSLNRTYKHILHSNIIISAIVTNFTAIFQPYAITPYYVIFSLGNF